MAQTPTNAQPETSTGQPLGGGYQPVTGSTNTQTPTSELQGAYVPIAIPTELGNQVLPDSQHTVTDQGPLPATATPKVTGMTPAASKAEAIAKLAQFFGIKDQSLGPSMEDRVLQALALKYNVQLYSSPTVGERDVRSRPTGAPARHKGRGESEASRHAEREAESTSTPPEPNKKALAEIAVKMGIDHPGPDLWAAIAGMAQQQGFNSPVLSSIQGDTNAEAYNNFLKTAFDPKTGALTTKGTGSGQEWEQTLVQSGYLDVNSNLGTPTANQVQQAFISMLNVATNGQKTGDPATTVAPGGGVVAALSAGQTIAKQTTQNAPPSEAYATVQGVASEFGVYLSPLQIADIANKFAGQITAEGSPADVENSIKDLVIKQYNPNNPNDPAGVANTMYTDIQQAALDYQIPMSQAQISQMVAQGLQTASVAYPASAATDVQNKAIQLFQEQASGLYPTLAAQIKAGQTVQNLVTPYYNVAESYTGVPASSMMVEGTKAGGPPSKWGAFLQGGDQGPNANPSAATKGGATPQGAEGPGQMMTIDQWKKELMQNPIYGFQHTQGARDMAEQLSSAILNELGKVNTNGSNPTPISYETFNPNSALQANTT